MQWLNDSEIRSVAKTRTKEWEVTGDITSKYKSNDNNAIGDSRIHMSIVKNKNLVNRRKGKRRSVPKYNLR